MIRPDAAVLLTKRSGESDVRVCRQPVGRDGPVVCDELLYGPSFQAKLTAARDVAATPADPPRAPTSAPASRTCASAASPSAANRRHLTAARDVAATPADLVETLRADNGRRHLCRQRQARRRGLPLAHARRGRHRQPPHEHGAHPHAAVERLVPRRRAAARPHARALVGLVPSPAQASRAEDGVSVNLVETVKAPGGLGVQPRRPGVACGVHEATGELRCTAEGCTANQYTSGNCPFRATTDPAAQFQLKAITATVDEARGEKRSHLVDVSACVSVAQLDPQSSFGRCAQERVRYELSKGLGIGECSAKDAPCRRLDGAREGR